MNMIFPKEYIYISGDYRTGHLALDIGTETGKTKTPPLWAIYDGIVTNIFNASDGGYMIDIKYDNGFKSRYCHGTPNSYKVKIGDRVKQFQEVMLVGNTGKSTGNHVHFILWNPSGVRVDPKKYCYIDTSKQRISADTSKKYILLTYKPQLPTDDTNTQLEQLRSSNKELISKNEVLTQTINELNKKIEILSKIDSELIFECESDGLYYIRLKKGDKIYYKKD